MAAYSILTLDLHNTVYDEALEYGLAIDAAVSSLLAAAESRGHTLTRETVYRELSLAHRTLGSDWDDGAWELLPSFLKLGLDEAHSAATLAGIVSSRLEKSRQLTLSTVYEGVCETLREAKSLGAHVYVVTEASAEAAARSLTWLALDGIVDGIYCYPSRLHPAALTGTFLKPFPSSAHGHVKKPHPLLLAEVVLENAIRKGHIPSSVTTADVFDTREDPAFRITELPASSPAQTDISARLIIKKTPHAAILDRVLKSMLYIGDSKFKDGLLARNAGVTFGYAAYGKKGQESEAARKSLAVMYAVTGWDKDTLKLTQEAGRAEAVNRLQPDFTFEESLKEAMPLFR